MTCSTGDKEVDASATTPDAVQVQKLMAAMVEKVGWLFLSQG